MTGDGRGTQVVVLGAVVALIGGLGAIALIGLQQNQRFLQEAVGIATVPPPDPARANSKLVGNVAQFFGPDSYPDDARDAGQQGSVRAELLVAPTGRVGSCRIARSSGHDSLDRRTCEIAEQQVRFEPARDRRGFAIASSYNLAVRWVLPED